MRGQDWHSDAKRAHRYGRSRDAGLRRRASAGAGRAGQLRGGQDPVDGAIRLAATGKVRTVCALVNFVPFDPVTKMSEAAAAEDLRGGMHRIVKGAFAAVIGLAPASPAAASAAQELEEQGFRVLAVAAGPPNAMKLAGTDRAQRSAAKRIRSPPHRRAPGFGVCAP